MKVAVSADPAMRRTWPLTACCTATTSPDANGSRSIQAGMSPPNPAETATPTATSANAEPTRRVTVIGAGWVWPMPLRSIASPLMVWPQTTATVKSATPSTAPVIPCESTKRAPPAPPHRYHHGVLPSRTEPNAARSPRRPGVHTASATVRMTRPEPKEITAAR